MSDETCQRPGEFELIARYFAPLAGPGGLGLIDDAGLLRPGRGYEVVVTADALVAGVHFFPDDPPAAIGWKALAVNLSDLAAKGAKPEGFALTIALPRDWTEAWLDAFAEGLGRLAKDAGCPLIGGDTVSTPGPLTLSITAFGVVPAGRMVRRTGAKPGDVVLVSGTIGDGALGLKVHGPDQPGWVAALDAQERGFLADRYLRPQPRHALAKVLQQHASAAMDVSDGLIGDLGKLLKASGVGAEIDLDTVPLSAPARAALMADPALAELAWTGGDDYEILCTATDGEVFTLVGAAAEAGIPLTAIGRIVAEPGAVRYGGKGERPASGSSSYSHF
ncbi:thiamine-phosphate kinase [Bosea sp. (in: a-proteobacteria)]|uniref:thiamine-phosphate kinase n=1 Tax=Bosea sp. (in: a-proteobacteria) TaxID=1871050 RepID=UPI0011FFEC3C|nr:thiamine-phosphate kinase [Bosea sp. (in: a-proteobacteria)]TAJ30141.1 MAG: thiamine-phosphate kinase [Bosea sp. (in: a-proteobacteria)]